MLQLTNITKAFSGVPVLHGIDLELNAGETLVLAGENGAGKSTLMKILAGVYQPDGGTMLLNGEALSPKTPLEAEQAGIAVIHQELSSIGGMSVADNLFLGRELSRFGFLNRHAQEEEARRILLPFGLDIDVRRYIEEFPISVRQLVEIAKATSRKAHVIVMDEPTSALSDPDVERLMDIMRDLKSAGAGLIFISHKMSEIYQVADRIMVMRDGRHVATAAADEMSSDALVKHLVGRDLTSQISTPPPPGKTEPVTISVKGLEVKSPVRSNVSLIRDITFDARRGEILGFAGLQGSGCSAIFLALFGAYGGFARADEITFGKLSRLPANPQKAIAAGMAYLPSDRKENGLVLPLSITSNIALPALKKFSQGGWVRDSQERNAAVKHINSLQIRTTGPNQAVQYLSGGNQQKVMLARCLETRPGLLMLDEPTRGVDVGAKHEIYEIIAGIRAQGTTILLITTEMPEMLGLADRICVLHRGRATAMLARADATQENILAAAMGEQD